MNIFLYYFRQFSPKDDVMPIGMVGHLSTILKRIATLGRGQPEARYGDPLFHISHFGVYPDVTYKHHLIHIPDPLPYPDR